MSTWDNIGSEGVFWIFAERYVLIVFYYATNGEHWLQQDNWLSPTLHVCDWSAAIICTTDRTQTRVVTGIQLTGNGLVGTIPDELSSISGLISLQLSQNARW